MTATPDDALDLMDELDKMLDHFDTVLATAEGDGFDLIAAPLREAITPLRQARDAAEEYAEADG